MSILQHIPERVAEASRSLYRVQSARGTESGWAWSEELILSCTHALPQEAPPQVTTLEGEVLEVEVLGADPRLDLLLMRATAGSLLPLKRGPTPRVGQTVLTLGVDLHGSGPRISSGLVAALGDPWLTPRGAQVQERLDVDAILPAGSSGGPLLNLEGELLGLNTHALMPGGTTLTLPTLEEAIERLREGGSVLPGRLGVKVHQLALPAEQAAAEQQATGMLILWQGQRSAARAAGLEVGDLLLKADGQPLTDFKSFRSQLSAAGGSKITLRFLRAGVAEERSVTIHPARRRRGPGGKGMRGRGAGRGRPGRF